MDESQKQIVCTRVHNMLLHLSEVLEQAQLIYGGKNQDFWGGVGGEDRLGKSTTELSAKK